jgi:hypothetical protein
MVATNASAIGNEMPVPHERNFETQPDSGIFVVRFRNDDDDIDATMAMLRLGKVIDRGDVSIITAKQHRELLRLGIAHEDVSAPPSYKEPAAKVQRK